MHQCAQGLAATPGDEALLQAFADNGSETAFQSLVERYLGMVLSIAGAGSATPVPPRKSRKPSS